MWPLGNSEILEFANATQFQVLLGRSFSGDPFFLGVPLGEVHLWRSLYGGSFDEILLCGSSCGRRQPKLVRRAYQDVAAVFAQTRAIYLRCRASPRTKPSPCQEQQAVQTISNFQIIKFQTFVNFEISQISKFQNFQICKFEKCPASISQIFTFPNFKHFRISTVLKFSNSKHFQIPKFPSFQKVQMS